ncbi:DUF72 domain-containing protein [candidate division KSB1 bacterium]
MAELRIGTCSWKYPSWEGLVYSTRNRKNYLEEYAGIYNTVEIDQWFWSLFEGGQIKLPKLSDVKTYRNSVSDDFRFSIKVPNSITLTHHYKKVKTDLLIDNPFFLSSAFFQKFLSQIEPLKDVIGPIMFQFEYLNKQKMKSQNRFQELFEEFIKQITMPYQFAVEIRNPNYLNKSYFEFLNRNSLSPVFLQGYYMPDITNVYNERRSLILQQKMVVIRLHGPDRQKIEKMSEGKWNQIYSFKDDELVRVAQMITDLLNRSVNVYLNVNNHFEGSAPFTINRIKKLL